MQILVSDSSMLIESSKRDLLDRMFELRVQFAVPDLLFNEELIDLGRYDRQGLVRLGLRVEALDPEGVATAIAYQTRRRALSLVVHFAAALDSRRSGSDARRSQEPSSGTGIGTASSAFDRIAC